MNDRRTRRMAEQSAPLRTLDRATTQLLELLARTGRPATVDELRREGISAPAQGIYELQLAGFEIDRVGVGEAGGRQAIGYRLRTPVPDPCDADEPAPSIDPAFRGRPGPNADQRAATPSGRERANRRPAAPSGGRCALAIAPLGVACRVAMTHVLRPIKL